MKFETARIHFWLTFSLLLPSSVLFEGVSIRFFTDIFDRLKRDKSYSHFLLPVYFVSLVTILKTNLFSHLLSKCKFILNFWFSGFFVYLWNGSTEFFFNFITKSSRCV